MFKRRILFILIFTLLYQSPLLSKSTSFSEFSSRNLSKYFSGIVALENQKNSDALEFFNTSKILINRHDPYLEKLVTTLVLEDKVAQAINLIRINDEKNNSQFFEAYVLLALDHLKKNNINKALEVLSEVPEEFKRDRFNFFIVNSIFQYANVFKYTKAITEELEYVNTTLLLSQGKSWIDRNQNKEFSKVFSCNDHNDIVGEFLFLISNLFSSQNEFEKSNFYLSLSTYLNPKFVFNFSLVAENLYLNKNYEKSKSVLKNFNKNHDFYYWFRLKKEAQIIAKTRNDEEALNYIASKFEKIENPNNKFIFDIANFYKNSKNYKTAIKYYSLIIDKIESDSEVKADLLYRRGGSYERLKEYVKADEDLLASLSINPNDAYVLNYLAYSWLERDFKIDEAIEMLEKAYEQENNDPYIIDSIGWAYYLVDDYVRAEQFLKRAVELMPDDPIVNDHYADILWKLDRKIQARYFWSMVLKMEDAEEDLLNQIKDKLITGPQNS